jgi:hypothetical protein
MPATDPSSTRSEPTHPATSEGTVKSHINRIFATIGARDRARAVNYAYQHGLA